MASWCAAKPVAVALFWLHAKRAKEKGINIALISGGGNTETTFGKNDFESILTNFSPISKGRNQIPTMSNEKEIDIIHLNFWFYPIW